MTQVLQAITYAREMLSPEFAGEVMPLLEQHFQEIDPFQADPLDPDWDEYFRAQAGDQLRIFTARDAGELIGYSVAFVRTDLHHKTSKRAIQDIFFIRADRRGFGFAFLLWVNEQLKGEGVAVDFQHISMKHDWGTMAKRAGYAPVETVWAKVL